MAGTFLLGQEDAIIRPGSYYRRTRTGVAIGGATLGYMAFLYQSNHGRLNAVVDLDATMMNNLEDYVGDAADLIREGFLGGAQMIRAVRVGSGGTCASITLLTALDVEAVKITARYAGSREFSVTVRDDLVTDSKQVIIYAGTEIFSMYRLTKGGDEAQALVDALLTDRWFIGEKLSAGELANVSQMALDGGENPTVTINSYSNGTVLLERYRWNVIVADTDDVEIAKILNAFVRQSYETGHLGIACHAAKLSTDATGKNAASVEERMKYAAACNDEKIVYLLSGWLDSSGVRYEGARAAARIGGMIAGSESNTSLTHDVIQDAIELIEPLTTGEITRAEKHGCLVLSINDSDQIWIDKGCTTLITPDDNRDKGWGQIRRTKTRFELIDRVNATLDPLIGNISNNDRGRGSILAAVQGIINMMVAEDKLLDGSWVEFDPSHPPEADHVHLKFHIGDCDSVERIFNTFVFRYGAIAAGEE